MLQMGARFANIARTAQAHAANPLSMDAFYSCPLIIHLSELLGLLSLASGFESFIGLAPPNGEGSSPGLGTLRAHGTGSTGRVSKLDFDDILLACFGMRPTTTDLSLRTAGLLLLPINGEIA